MQCSISDSARFVTGRQGKTFVVRSPYDDCEICDVFEAQQQDVDVAVVAAESSFPSWSGLASHERASNLSKIAQLIGRDAQELT